MKKLYLFKYGSSNIYPFGIRFLDKNVDLYVVLITKPELFTKPVLVKSRNTPACDTINIFKSSTGSTTSGR